MSEPEEEFAALMARVRRDDNQALARLIALYEPAVRRTAHFLLGKALRSSLDPTDLVQSVHLQVIRGLKQERFTIASPQELRSLAVTLLRHKSIECWRRHRCQARYHVALAAGGVPSDGRAVQAGPELDPRRAAEYQDLLDHLCRRLRAEERRLVLMRLLGYRTREIAVELGISPAVVRARLSRLRKRLRREQPQVDRI